MPHLHDPGLDAAERKALQDIAEYGWHAVHVGPDPGDPTIWTYTLGLPTTWGHPEIILFGLSMDVAHTLLWNLVDEIKLGVTFYDGDRAVVFPAGGYEAAFLDVDAKWFSPFMGWAQWYHEGGHFSAVQCAWPDKDHHLPWDQQYRDPRSQPLLVSDDTARALTRDQPE